MRIEKWLPDLSIKIDVVDHQHKEIFGKIDELSELLDQGTSKEIMKEKLNELYAVFTNHFEHEKEIFNKYDYSEAYYHIREHEKFMTKLIALTVIFEDGRYAISIDTIHFLYDWITNHIRTMDMAYAAFISSQNNQIA